MIDRVRKTQAKVGGREERRRAERGIEKGEEGKGKG